MAGSIKFSISEVESEIADDDLAALIDEVGKIASTAPTADVVGLLETLTAATEREAVLEPTDRELEILMRATDHLRNLGHAGRPVLELRDRLRRARAVEVIVYELDFADGRPSRQFISCSLKYLGGDRLVDGTGGEHRVIAVFAAQVGPRLVVTDWGTTH